MHISSRIRVHIHVFQNRVPLPASSLSHLVEQRLRALGHALVHESEEADGAGADAHAVDEAGGEEGAEDGAEVGFGDLL